MVGESMHDRVIRLYKAGKITQTELHNAVAYGWITEEEYQELING